MRAGRLRRRVQLQSKTTTRNDYGEPVETWSTQATVWARVRVGRGQEMRRGDVADAQYTHEIGIRERSDVDERWRALWNGRTLDIVGVSPPEKPGGEMVLMCKEVRSG